MIVPLSFKHGQQEGLNSPQTIKQNMTDVSKDSLIAAKNN